MLKKRYTLLILLLAFVTASCSDGVGNKPNRIETVSVYALSEGNFSDSNGGITSYDPGTGKTIKEAFKNKNDRPFAGIIQGADVFDNRLYIAANMANKIEIVDRQSLESIKTISLEDAPISIGVLDNKTALVGMLDDTVAVLDLAEGELTSQTVEGEYNSPRDIVSVGDKAYITNNGFGNANTVSVVDINSYELIDTITVGAAPTEMIVDGENRIWVSCNGKASFDGTSVEEPGSLYIIDGNSGQVITSITEGIAADGAGYTYRLALDEEHAEAYLINNGVSVIDMNSYEIKEQIIDSGDYSAI